MYEKYLEQLEEAGKIRNLKERSINCYKNYVSYFLKYQNKNPEESVVWVRGEGGVHTQKSSLYAGISSDAKNIFQSSGIRRCQKYWKQLYGINIYVCKSCGGHLGKPQLRIPQRC